jgi:hypothetical protein
VQIARCRLDGPLAQMQAIDLTASRSELVGGRQGTRETASGRSRAPNGTRRGSGAGAGQTPQPEARRLGPQPGPISRGDNRRMGGRRPSSAGPSARRRPFTERTVHPDPAAG